MTAEAQLIHTTQHLKRTYAPLSFLPKSTLTSNEKKDATQRKSFFRSAYIFQCNIHSIRGSVRFEMSGNTLEISWWETYSYDRGMKHSGTLYSAAVDALSASSLRGQFPNCSSFIPHIYSFLVCFSKHIRGNKPLEHGNFIFIPFDKHTKMGGEEGGAAENAEKSNRHFKSYWLEVWG